MAMRIPDEHGDYEPSPFASGLVARMLLLDTELSPGAKVVFGILTTYADERGVARPSQRQLVADTGRSRMTIWRTIRTLEDSGYLEIHSDPHTGQEGVGYTWYALMTPGLREQHLRPRSRVCIKNDTYPTASDQVGITDDTYHETGVITPNTGCAAPAEPLVGITDDTYPAPPTSRVSSGRLKLPRRTSSPDRSRLSSNEVRPPPIVPPTRKKNTGVNRTIPKSEIALNSDAALADVPKPPSKLAVVIDGLKAAGVEYLGNPARDGKALKDSAASPELVLEAYLAVRSGHWHNPWLRTNLSVLNVVNVVTGYSDWKARGCPPEPVSRGRGVQQVSRQQHTLEEWREDAIRHGVEIDPE